MDRQSLPPRSPFPTSLSLLLLAIACSDSDDRKVPRAQPLSACARESGCVGCTTCREVCLCSGQSPSLCDQSCGSGSAGASGAAGAGGSGVAGASGSGTGGAGMGGGATGGGGGCSSWWPTPECSSGGAGGQLGEGGQAGTSSSGTGGQGGSLGGRGGAGGSGTSGGAAGAAGAAGSTAGSAGTGAGGRIGTGGAAGAATGGTGQGGAGGTCVGQAQDANTVAPRIHLMVETSSRMTSAWAALRDGITAFVQGSGSAGAVVGFDTFPALGECNGSMYPGPYGVAPAMMPTGAAAMVSAVSSITPSGLATLEEGLSGVVALAEAQYARDASNAAVLIVGGDPTSCSTSSAVLSQIARDARSSAYPIKTYVLVVGSAATPLLSAIASAGETQQAQGSLSTSLQIANALASLRNDLVSCTFSLPRPAPADWGLVNVQLRVGTSVNTIPQVSSAASCGAQSAWYYDVPALPNRIELCPTACASFKQDAMPRVTIVMGCPTVRTP